MIQPLKGGLMKTRSALLAATFLVLVLCFSLVAAASAAKQSFAAVSAVGAVGFQNDGTLSFATFSARAVGPAAPDAEHQPARGSLLFASKLGVRFFVAVEHIHAHSATEVHFGGTIQRSSDPSLVGKFAHCVAVDAGSPGREGDLFSILVTASDTHEHAVPVPVLFGDLVVRTPGM
jgi:hypothetical protein